MKKHETMSFYAKGPVRIPGEAARDAHYEIEFCVNCGIVWPNAFYEGRCPPWSSTGEGEDTKTNRAREAGEVEKVRIKLETYEELIQIAKKEGVEFITVDSLLFAVFQIRKLIQKHEGLSRG